MKTIYRTYEDTHPASLYTDVKCPYCSYEQAELNKDQPGETYEVECLNCKKKYQMHFDAS